MTQRTSKLTGVIARDNHIQIDLRAYGFGKERLDLTPTPSNLKLAARTRLDILGKIERGTFVLGDYFPASPRVQLDVASLTWKQLRTEWVAVKKGEIAHSTLDHYEQTLTSKHFRDWDSLHIGVLDYRTLMAKLASLPQHPKTFNNIASVLGMVLEYGFKAKLLREPLHENIEFRKNRKPAPDPFTLDEVRLILGKMRSPAGLNYYEFAFFSGLRPSEQIALEWSKCDLSSRLVIVDEAITRGLRKGTKTDETRVVELNRNAWNDLVRQQSITQQAGGSVFIGLDGHPYTTTDGPLGAFWKPAVELAGVRYRDARQTRHTYATMCLHVGSKPGWVAAQLGHSVEMFYRVYSKWIDEQDRGAERAKLDAFLAASDPRGKCDDSEGVPDEERHDDPQWPDRVTAV